MLKAISDLVESIQMWNNNIARLHEPAGGQETNEETTERRQEYLGLVDEAKKKIGKINKLHSNVIKCRTLPVQRTIGFVLRTESIAVSDGPTNTPATGRWSNSTRTRPIGARSRQPGLHWSILVRFPYR